MNKIIASAGLAALGAANMHVANASGLATMDKPKPWSVSGIIRGFYDDNPTDSVRTAKEESWGIEFSPSLAVNLAFDQTTIGFNYTYDLRYFEARPTHDTDHAHEFDLKIDHPFNDRYKLQITDDFHYAVEPELTDITTNPLRTEQNYLHNRGRIGFTAELTPILGLEVAYQNDYWAYEQDGFSSSLSALMDRTEHLGSLIGRWQALPNTIALLGYEYGVVDHNSSDLLLVPTNLGTFLTDSNVRDQTSHFIWVGADQKFNPQLDGQVRVGAQFTDYPNTIPGQSDSSVGPYVDASATWTYNPGSTLQLGVKHRRNQTDVISAQDQESTAFYGTLNHRITPKLTGSLLGQYQHSNFKGGVAAVDGEVDQFGTLGCNLSYQVNAFVSAEAGYNYDRLDSDLPNRSYTRNRVYFGLRASY
jgi:hypothetical protein